MALTTFGQDRTLQLAKRVFGSTVRFGVVDFARGIYRLHDPTIELEICRGTIQYIVNWLHSGAKQAVTIFDELGHLSRVKMTSVNREGDTIVSSARPVASEPAPILDNAPIPLIMSFSSYDPLARDRIERERHKSERAAARAIALTAAKERRRLLNGRQLRIPHAPRRARLALGWCG